eukprot:scaffold8365_cov267-Pinguiococcus_pyrenoidosus.AAC.7
MQAQVGGDDASRGPLEHGVRLGSRRHSQQIHVRAQRALSHAVGMKVELVLHEVLEVLVHGEELLQCQAILPLPQLGLGPLQLVPAALHLVEIELRVSLMPREKSNRGLRLLDTIRAEQVLCRLVVNIPKRTKRRAGAKPDR